MSEGNNECCTKAQSVEQTEELRRRREEAEQTLEAIRQGDVDALVVSGPKGEQVYSLAGAEHVYRVIFETMGEAALTVDADGTILFCNQRFCDLVKTPIQGAMSRKLTAFAAGPQQLPLKKLLADAHVGPVQRRLTLRATDGTAVPVQFSASPLQIGDSAGVCLAASDLTDLEVSVKSARILREHRQSCPLLRRADRYHRPQAGRGGVEAKPGTLGLGAGDNRRRHVVERVAIWWAELGRTHPASVLRAARRRAHD